MKGHGFLTYAVVVLVLLGGCLQAGQVSNDLETYSGTKVLEFKSALTTPIVVNETESGEGLWHRLVFDDCPFPQWMPPEVQLIRIWDRNGLVSEEVVDVDPDLSEQWFWIPLQGEAPWVIAGARYACSWLQQVKLYNITDGYSTSALQCKGASPLPPGCLNMNEAKSFYNLSFELPIGSMQAEYTWQISDYAWNGHGGFPVIEENRSGFSGTIRMYYPNGDLWREDRFPLTGGRDADFTPLIPIPGEHKIVIEADAPPLQTVKGRYDLLYSEIDETICNQGFEWEIC